MTHIYSRLFHRNIGYWSYSLYVLAYSGLGTVCHIVKHLLAHFYAYSVLLEFHNAAMNDSIYGMKPEKELCLYMHFFRCQNLCNYIFPSESQHVLNLLKAFCFNVELIVSMWRPFYFTATVNIQFGVENLGFLSVFFHIFPQSQKDF